MNVIHSGLDLPGDDFPMPAPVEEAAVAPPRVVSTASQKMLQLLRKRLRQLLWCILGLSLAAGVFAIWWLTSLYGLPDIGDPFDVAAFKSYQIPDDQNGVAFFQKAFEKLTPLPEVPYAMKTAAATGSWSKLDPKLQRLGGRESPGDRVVTAGSRSIRRELGFGRRIFLAPLPHRQSRRPVVAGPCGGGTACGDG